MNNVFLQIGEHQMAQKQEGILIKKNMYINGTSLCAAANKRLSNWKRLKTVNIFLRCWTI